METGFIDEKIRKRKSSGHGGRFLLAGALLVLSLVVAKEQRAKKKSENE